MRVNGKLQLRAGDAVVVEWGKLLPTGPIGTNKFIPCELLKQDEDGLWLVKPAPKGWPQIYVAEEDILLRDELPAGSVTFL